LRETALGTYFGAFATADTGLRINRNGMPVPQKLHLAYNLLRTRFNTSPTGNAIMRIKPDKTG
jgi:hypothetical protein